MKIQEVILRAISKEITWAAGGRIHHRDLSAQHAAAGSIARRCMVIAPGRMATIIEISNDQPMKPWGQDRCYGY